MNDYVNCHRCGITIDSSISIRIDNSWFCSESCYSTHKAYKDGYKDGQNDKTGGK